MSERDESPEPAPLSFKIMLVLAAAYLGWRLVQLIGRLIDWIF